MVLGIVLVCICLVIWVIRRFAGHTPMLLDKRVGRVVGRLYLSPKNVIFLVHVADRILVVGTAQNAIECLAEITDPAAVGRIVEGRDTFAESLDKAARHIAAEPSRRRARASVEEHIEDIGQQLERLKALEENETETP
jgi:flagellar biogenesis protein FliO